MASEQKLSRNPKTKHQILDSDGHVIEPAVIWSDYAESEYRERLAPGPIALSRVGMAQFESSQSAVSSGGMGAGISGVVPAAVGPEIWEEESRTKMSLPGGQDPIPRLKDMDTDGIDVAVLYPTGMLFWFEDPALYAAACRAYNNWLRDYCSADASRLYGVGVMPLQDVPAAIAEMNRCVYELGFKAVMIRPAPYLGTKKLYHPDYDPFWQAAVDANCPIGVHPLPFSDMPNVARGLRLNEGTDEETGGLAIYQGLTNCLDMMVATGWFAGTGICERFPGLKVGILEGSGGWIVTLLERLDHHHHIFGNPLQKTPPSEIFKRQMWISFDPDEVALPFTAEQLGPDRILWASDYPHPDAKIPGVVDELLEAVEPLPEESQRLIVGATGAAFYNI